MFNSNSFGFVKVAYVADYGNFHIVPHAVKGLGKNDRPSKPKQRRAVFTLDNAPMPKRKVGRMFLDVPY